MIPVFYRPEMSVANNASFSPSAGKPALAVADWQAEGMPIDVRSFEPVSRADLSLVHDPLFVDAVFAGDEPNGFGNTDPAVAEACRYTCGSMVAAALHALAASTIAVSPSSGFHHAHYASAGGYCTFNGLALAALKCLQAGAHRVAIIDCDQHDGDGTRDILTRLAFGKRVAHFSMGERRFTRHDVQAFYDWLEAVVDKHSRGCDVILYQAGADPHVSDPLGGFLHDAQLSKRDSIVLSSGRRIAWNLAGGYQRDAAGSIAPVLELHRNTMTATRHAMNLRQISACP